MGNIYLWSGLFFVATGLVALVTLFRPVGETKTYSPNIVASTQDSSRCAVTLMPVQPTIFSRYAYANVAIATVPTSAESLEIDWPVGIRGAKISFSDLVEQPDGSVAQEDVKIEPKSKSGGFVAYEVERASFADPSRNWMIMLDRAVVGRRVAFGCYSFLLPINVSPGQWRAYVSSSSAHEVLGGAEEEQIVSGPYDSNGNMTGLLNFDVTIKFVSMDAWRDMCSILFSTLLGLGLALVVEGIKSLSG